MLEVALAFAVTAAACLALQPLARRWGLVDRPGGRKTHHGEVPLVGGIAMLLGIAVAIPLAARPGTNGVGNLLAACLLLTAVGVFDDRFEVRPRIRLLVHTLAVLVGASAFQLDQLTLGAIFGNGTITFVGLPAAAMIVLLTAGIVNAMNMMDGADGLAGIVAIIALGAMAALEAAAGSYALAPVALAGGGAAAAFLLFNAPALWNRRARVFMGDAGATLLGFVMAWVALGITQGPRPAAWPVTMLWLAALPLYDLLWSIGRRALRGRSPFEADRGHLHHLLLDGGLGVRATFAVFALLAVAWAGTGIALQALRAPQWLSFALFIACGFVTFWIVRMLPAAAAFAPAWRRDSASTGSVPGSRGPAD
jgi:UDP-GlcNAc:undecaprenyl-phosphate GlcNAc-1-phosphate transferase